MEIKSLLIENYGCLKNFKLDKLKRINVLVGRNNTGKSSVLEALTLAYSSNANYYDAMGNDLLKNILINRKGLDDVRSQYIINIDADKGMLMVKLTNEASFKVEILHPKITSNIPREILDKAEYVAHKYAKQTYTQDTFGRPVRLVRLGREVEAIDEIVNELLKKLNLILLRFENEALSDVCVITRLHEENRILRGGNRNHSPIIFVGKGVDVSVENLYVSLGYKGKLVDVLGRFGEKHGYVKDIRMIEGELFVFQHGLDKPIPLNLMGDGFKATLLMDFLINLGDEIKVVVLEEPENHLHPGLIEHITREIVAKAKNGKIQFFISTHTNEFLENLLEAEAGKEITQIIRMYRMPNGDINYEILDWFEAKEELTELKADLRGL